MSHLSLRRSIVCALLATAALFGAACGGSGKSSPPTSSNSTVATADTDVGSILVDRSGDTLYLFEKDSGGASSCAGACAKAWPPYTAKGAALHPGPGVKAALLKSMTRADGTKQLTYDGHPLYTFSGDSKAGDIAGQGSQAFGAHWYVVSPDGSAIQKAAPSGHMGY
jgi:predicted lipoprotein with Yx(FWY)xxD motif